MPGTIERELGNLRADVQNLIRAVDRLVDKFDGHVDDDDTRFRAIDEWRYRTEGGKAMASTMRAGAFSALGLVGGGLGGWLAKWFGGH